MTDKVNVSCLQAVTALVSILWSTILDENFRIGNASVPEFQHYIGIQFYTLKTLKSIKFYSCPIYVWFVCKLYVPVKYL
jgi:hypothetical protein